MLVAVSWRVALLLFASLPALTAVSSQNPDTGAGRGIGLCIVFYPLLILSAWQILRRISKSAINLVQTIAGTEVDMDDERYFSLAEIVPWHPSSGFPRPWWRYAPTVVECLVGGWIVLVFGALFLPLATRSFSPSQQIQSSPEYRQTAVSSPDTASPSPANPSNPDANWAPPIKLGDSLESVISAQEEPRASHRARMA
jgi:hypothetical protein